MTQPVCACHFAFGTLGISSSQIFFVCVSFMNKVILRTHMQILCGHISFCWVSSQVSGHRVKCVFYCNWQAVSKVFASFLHSYPNLGELQLLSSLACTWCAGLKGLSNSKLCRARHLNLKGVGRYLSVSLLHMHTHSWGCLYPMENWIVFCITAVKLFKTPKI